MSQGMKTNTKQTNMVEQQDSFSTGFDLIALAITDVQLIPALTEGTNHFYLL